ncbi:uncharacterized protein LOC144720561 isoform X3 [Lampetra planeri]
MDLLGSMEANRDAAMSCRENARAALSRGDTKQARRFIDKAQQLYPCDEEDHELLACVNKHEEAAVMLKDVERICNACSYYEVLEVQSAASTEEIRRAFKLQSLKVHPNKNHMPRAADAFKMSSAEVLCRFQLDITWPCGGNGGEHDVPDILIQVVSETKDAYISALKRLRISFMKHEQGDVLVVSTLGHTAPLCYQPLQHTLRWQKLPCQSKIMKAWKQAKVIVILQAGKPQVFVVHLEGQYPSCHPSASLPDLPPLSTPSQLAPKQAGRLTGHRFCEQIVAFTSLMEDGFQHQQPLCCQEATFRFAFNAAKTCAPE